MLSSKYQTCFLPIKLPPVYGPPFFYKSIHIALDENHRGNCSGLMVPTSKILGIGSPPKFGKELISFLSRANVRPFHENPNRIHTELTFIHP